MELLALEEAEAPPDLRAQVVALQLAMTPQIVRDISRTTHDQCLRPVTMVLVVDDVVVTSLDILSKEIVHAGERYEASGLSWVVTGQEYQGRGYGQRLVAAARDRIAASRADVGLFTCDRALHRSYAGAGWELLPGTVLVGGTADDPFASDQPGLDKVTFGGFFTERALQPSGRLRRCPYSTTTPTAATRPHRSAASDLGRGGGVCGAAAG